MDFYNCTYTLPKTFADTPPATSSDFWQFSAAACEIPQQQTITDGTSTFYLQKNVSYGDLALIFFLILFLFLAISGIIWSIIYKK
jgi:hypothetical protein